MGFLPPASTKRPLKVVEWWNERGIKVNYPEEMQSIDDFLNKIVNTVTEEEKQEFKARKSAEPVLKKIRRTYNAWIWFKYRAHIGD